MKNIFSYITTYAREINKWVFVLACLFTAFLIYCNYNLQLNKILTTLHEPAQYIGWFSVFFIAFVVPYLLHAFFEKKHFFRNKQFATLLIIAPALFAWKISSNLHFNFSENQTQNNYWNQVAYWPFKLAIISTVLILIWKMLEKEQPLYGWTLKDFSSRPYFIMLLIMVPLIAAASTQPDFLTIYPKLKNMYSPGDTGSSFYKILYELSYGSDFISIEFFFRGFLVLAFMKWVGKDAILPMAVFYCTIHFGKPIGECISSFFGGLLLGIITFNTRSIIGGLIVHLGIAWLMELGGYIGNIYK